MNSFIKNLLGLTVILGLLGFLYFGYSMAKTYDRSSEPTNFRSFYVSGSGKAVGTPDIASFSFEVITEWDTDVGKLQTENAEKMNTTIDFVKKQGIDAADIKTAQYSINPRYSNTVCDYSIKGEPCESESKISGYTVQQTVFVKIRDFKKISDLLSGVVKNGANSVGQLQFTIDNSDALTDTARAEAVKKAQEKAEKMAQAGGFTLGRLLEISENFTSPYYDPRMMVMDTMSKSESAVAPTIEAGSQEINIEVSLRYEIK
jgi:uncharacterized protein